MIYTDKSQLQGKNFHELIQEILEEIIARNISTRGHRFYREKSERKEFEDIANLFERTPQPLYPDSNGFMYTPLGIDSDDCKLYYNIFDYARDCGVYLPQDFRHMKTFDLLWNLHQILANVRYRKEVVSGTIYWRVNHYTYETPPPQDVYNRFAQSHWLEDYKDIFEGYHIHASKYYYADPPLTNRASISFITETSYTSGFIVPYKLSYTYKGRAYFGFGDVPHDVPESTAIYGTEKDVFLSRYPDGHIDVDKPVVDGDEYHRYESEILFPEYTVQNFSCLPIWVYDNASEIVANGGTLPGYTP